MLYKFYSSASTSYVTDNEDQAKHILEKLADSDAVKFVKWIDENHCEVHTNLTDGHLKKLIR